MFPVAGISTGASSRGAAVTARSANRSSRRRVIRGPRDCGSTLAELPTDVVMAGPPLPDGSYQVVGNSRPQPVTPPRALGDRLWKSTSPTQVGRTVIRAILVPG